MRIAGARSLWAKTRRRDNRSRKICGSTWVCEGDNTVILAVCNRNNIPVALSSLSPESARDLGEHLVDFANRKERMDWQDYEREDED